MVDDIGQLPVGQEVAVAFYCVVDAAYERRSVVVTSNLHPSGFDTFMPKGLATAAVDRLLHHAHGVITEGTSTRLTEALAGGGSAAPSARPPAKARAAALGDEAIRETEQNARPVFRRSW